MTENKTTQSFLTADQEGYRKGLKHRHIQMMAIGSAIGTGLFLGAGGRLHDAGPSLFIAYAVCGFFGFLVLRAIGELVMHRPSSGGVVSYAREFLGERAAYLLGWNYFLQWAITGIADVTAFALYLKFWSVFDSVPQWVLALVALVVVVGFNMIGVAVFGELEFWFSLIKVAAIVIFLVTGVIFILTGHSLDGVTPGLSNIADHGGIFPEGVVPLAVVTSGVFFAYLGIEVIATAAGETENARAEMPRAVNNVVWRILVLYCGSVLVMSLLLPYTEFKADESPFVTVFSKVGISQMGDIMNLVVITAVLSSLNAGLYSTGRVIRTMSHAGSAPHSLGELNNRGVPFGGIALTSVVVIIGVIINYVAPGRAFDIAMNLTAVTLVLTWGAMIIAQMKLMKRAERGEIERPSFRMPLAPYSNWLTLAFLLLVVVLVASGDSIGFWTIVISIPIILVVWFSWRWVKPSVERRRAEFEAKVDRVAVDPAE
ncbi:amino acid permease [uncultured Corynebacterium sp.]|uniref:amino acid permease n=1 Tax=uncultured Corynebacterium sp. TaxID=159447 RepID=UPI0025D005FA|nr:amino acid permease [uncultured Corynebacterium sp.]